MDHVLPSNEAHVDRAVETVVGLGHRRIGMFGLTFKAGTDDLRESPLVELVERLIGKGHDVRVHDSVLVLARLLGANRAFVDDRLPHLAQVLVDDPGEVAAHGGTVIVGSRDEQTLTALEGLARRRAGRGSCASAHGHAALARSPLPRDRLVTGRATGHRGTTWGTRRARARRSSAS